MPISTYLKHQILNRWLRNIAGDAAPATVYVALFTSAPAADGTGGNEVGAGVGYGRLAVAFRAPGTPDGTTDNSALVQFAQPTGNWGTVTHAKLMSANAGGNVLFWAAITPRVIDASTTPPPRFDIAELLVDLNRLNA